LENCYIVGVHSPIKNYFIQDKLLIEGITTIEMFFLGEDLVLIKPIRDDLILELVKEVKESLRIFFFIKYIYGF